MCGIAGFIRRKREAERRYRAIDEMLDMIRHRGPDDTGVCGVSLDGALISANCAENISADLSGVFGFNRLSIQDLTAAGHQPMLSPQKDVVLSFNGEIYNVRELREELKALGHFFEGKSDTEVILHMYLEYGFEKMVKGLNGIFAIVLYDARMKKLFICRDRFGVIPVYTYFTDDQVAYASEIKCFMKLPGFKCDLDEQYLNESVMYSFPAAPMYKGVEAVEPGSAFIIDLNTGYIEKKCYFNINEYQKQNINFEDAVEKANLLLKNCVDRQLISDVNVGVQFSGGVDSTLIAKYAAEIVTPQKNLCAFSMINGDAEDISEEKWIDHAADRLPVELNKIDIGLSAFLQGLEQCTWAYEKFVNTPSAIGIYNPELFTAIYFSI